MKIIFFGTPEFAAHHLEYLIHQGIEVVAVVTKPDKPQGRSLRLQPPPVKVLAQELIPHVPLFQPEKCSTPDFVEVLRSFQADLFVVVAYGEIIKQAVLDLPRFGCINVHASLLPRYRGAAPMQRALMNGEVETGISIIQLVLKMDAGDILHMEKIPILQNMTLQELEKALCDLGCRCLIKVIHDFEQGTVTRQVQDAALVTFADKITSEECHIDWTRPALTIHNLIRGTSPSPGAWCYITVRGQKKRLKILRSEYIVEEHGSPGSIFQKGKDTLGIACGRDSILLFDVQLEGKQAMAVKELLKGIPIDQLQVVL